MPAQMSKRPPINLRSLIILTIYLGCKNSVRNHRYPNLVGFLDFRLQLSWAKANLSKWLRYIFVNSLGWDRSVYSLYINVGGIDRFCYSSTFIF